MPVRQNERAAVGPDQDAIKKTAELDEISPRIE